MSDYSEQSYTKSAEPDFGFENVLASYVRRQEMSLKDIQRRWNLTDGEARGVMYASAGRATLRKILKHENGGWDIGLMLLTGVIGHDLNEHIERRRAYEKAHYDRIERSLRKMVSDLPLVLGLDSSSPH